MVSQKSVPGGMAFTNTVIRNHILREHPLENFSNRKGSMLHLHYMESSIQGNYSIGVVWLPAGHTYGTSRGKHWRLWKGHQDRSDICICEGSLSARGVWGRDQFLVYERHRQRISFWSLLLPTHRACRRGAGDMRLVARIRPIQTCQCQVRCAMCQSDKTRKQQVIWLHRGNRQRGPKAQCTYVFQLCSLPPPR